MEYIAISSGNCESMGLNFIKSKEDCIVAAKYVGVHNTGHANPSGNRPMHCGTWEQMKYLYFNPQASGILGGYAILEVASDHARQICRKGKLFQHIWLLSYHCVKLSISGW